MAFPTPDLGALAWIALVPLLLAAHGRSPREAFWAGYAWGIIALGGVLWWLTAFGVAVWMIAAALAAIFPGVTLAAVAWFLEHRPGPWAFLAVPVLWTAVEFLRSQGPLGFPWALLGESQHRALAAAQIASVTGIYGVTFLVALVNAALYALAARRSGAVAFAVAAAAAAGTIVWGEAALRGPEPATITAAVIQPDYATRVRWHAPDAERDLATLEGLTREAAARGASLVVWPETASPTDILGDPGTFAAIGSWARRDHISLIASSLEGGRANSAFSFAPSGALLGRYEKVRLVPFAEFGETAGGAPAALLTPEGAIGTMICFESAFPDLARREAAGGAGFLAVITNDAWFDGRAAPAQHAAIAPFRAIEEGRYLLRAANSGWSQIIDPRGRVLAELPPMTRGILTAKVAPLRRLTPYARLGDAFGWGTVVAGAALLLPAAREALAGAPEQSALLRLLAVSGLPLAVLWASAQVSSALGISEVSVAGFVLPIPLLALFAATAIGSSGRPLRALGLRAAGFPPAACAGVAAVAVLAAISWAAFSSQGQTPALPPPAGGWWRGTAVQVLIVGFSLEWWLRGLVFAAAESWRGWKAAVLWSTLLGFAAGVPRGAEAMVWGLCSGAAFGLIRARWAQVPALALSHGVGNVLLGFLMSPW